MLNNEASAATLSTLSNIAAQTSTVTGSAVDVRDREGQILVQQVVGTVSGTAPTLDGKIQDSADGSTDWQDVSGATFTQVTASNSAQKIVLQASGVRGYVRYVGTIAGGTPSFMVGAFALARPKTV